MVLADRTILHVDMDSFYASVEIREHPEYKGKPVIIGADPRGGKGRGVVAACSYEARKYGIHSAMPISKAYKLCPEGIYLIPNFTRYELVSDQIMDFLRTYTSKFEQVSIDEAYMDVSEKVKNYSSPLALAGEIQEGILNKFDLTCSIGIAHNKSIAKIASAHNKPAGLTYVPHDNFRNFLEPLPVGKISGCGPKTESVLNNIGIITISELAGTSRQRLVEALGKYGLYLWDIANGLESEEVMGSEGRLGSISHEYTFERDTNDFEQIEEILSDLSQRLVQSIKEEHLYYKTVTLKIRFQDFETFTRSKSLSLHSRSLEKLRRISFELLKEFRSPWRKVRLIGLKLSNLKALDESQATLKKWN